MAQHGLSNVRGERTLVCPIFQIKSGSWRSSRPAFAGRSGPAAPAMAPEAKGRLGALPAQLIDGMLSGGIRELRASRINQILGFPANMDFRISHAVELCTARLHLRLAKHYSPRRFGVGPHQ